MRTTYPALTTLLAAGALAAGCGGGEADRALCGYVDAAGSTVEIRPDYLDELRDRASQAAEDGRTLRVVVGTGAPLVESSVLTESFSDVTGLEKLPQRDARLTALLGDLAQQVADAEDGLYARADGSAIAAGLTLLARGGACETVVAYTDGLETVDINVYTEDILTAQGRAELVDRLRGLDRVPDLRGTPVEFPFGGTVPQGSELSKKRQAALGDWWAAWTKAAGGKLRWGS